MDKILKIINYLGKNVNQSFTMHQLSNLTSIPYASFHRTIKKMKNLIILEKVGKSTIIKLNTKNPITKSYLTIASEEEKEEYLNSNPIIKKITNELDNNEGVVILFGSYAKEAQTERSDIDLLIINNKSGKKISFSKYELLFKKKINPISITKKEFKLMLKDKEENVGKQALKNHIILKNPSIFWGMVFNGI